MKLKNILLDLNGNCKISNIFHIVEENEFNRYDLPQFGYLVYQMLTGNILNNYDEDANNLLNGLISSNVSNEFIEFFKQITLTENEFQTSKMSIQATLDMKSHTLFNDIDWTKLENEEIQAPYIPDRVLSY